MSKKVTYIVSDVDKALAFEWTALSLKNKYELSFILIGAAHTKLAVFLRTHNITFWEVTDENNRTLISKWRAVFNILRKHRPDVVHAHLWRAMLLGISASWALRINKRVFTRHHSMLHHVNYPSGKKFDAMCNYLATHIIAISENVKNVLIEKEGVAPAKVHVVHHGFDVGYFQNVEKSRVESVRQRINVAAHKRPVVGVISRYLKLKGIQFVIPAFKKLLEKHPEAFLILANTSGDYSAEIRRLLQVLPERSYLEVPFESDLAALYRIFDVFVHVPIDPFSEAFGQTYVESLLAGVPAIFTLSGVAPEFIRNKFNAIVVDFGNADAIFEGMERLINDTSLRQTLVQNGQRSAVQFRLDNMITKLVAIYD